MKVGAYKTLLNGLSWGAQQSLPITATETIAAWLVAQFAQRDVAKLSDKESEHMLQTVIDAIPVPIFFKDELHIYRGCNKAFNTFLGLPADKVIGHSVYDVAPKELADIYYQADCKLLAQGNKQVYETQVKSATGETFEIEFNKAVFYKRNGHKGGQVGVMLNITERNQLMRQLERASLTDPLTGVSNRREFDKLVRLARQNSQKSDSPVSLLILDLDHFKNINDAHGHDGGDQALQFVVQKLLAVLPEYAHLFRIGGEEFYILMEQTDEKQAQQYAEYIRNYLSTQSLILKGAHLSMTMSIGVIEIKVGCALDGILKRVDQALYQAKSQGRNKVCLAREA